MKRKYAIDCMRTGMVFCALGVASFAGAQSAPANGEEKATKPKAGEVKEEVQWHVATEAEMPSGSVTGLGANQSGVTRGTRYFKSVNVNGSGASGGLQWRTSLGWRATSDPKADPQPVSLSNLKLELRQGPGVLGLGDNFTTFSQYSLSAPLKGAAFTLGNPEARGTNLTMVWGNADSRWQVFAPGETTQSTHRMGVGARLAQRLDEDTEIGVSFLRSDDSGRIDATDPLFRNDIVSLTAEHALAGWKISGEAAWSDTRLSPDATTGDSNYRGRALRLDANGKLGKRKILAQYERVSSDFVTNLGSAQADRERLRLRLREKWSRNVSASYGLLWYQNNLDGNKDFRTTALRPELAINFYEFGGRPDASLDLSVTSDSRYGGATRNDDVDTMATYRDVIAGWDTEWNVGVARYYARDSRDSREFTVNTSWYGRVPRGAVVYRPSFSLGAWNATDHSSDSTDRTYEASLGLGIEWPGSRASLETRLGYRKAEVGLGDNNSRLFGSLTANYRPKALQAINGGLYCRFACNDFRYTGVSRDFKETTLSIGFKTEF